MSSLLAQLNNDLTALVDMSVTRTCTVFPMNMNIRTGSHGSGWMYSSEHIVTNNHVVDGAGIEVMIRTAREGELRAKVLGVDPTTDLAVLKVAGLTGQPFTVRNAPARVGEICLAIGTPMLSTLQNSVSLGVVSGVGRQVALNKVRFEEVIQTDAIINGGNSGGPLIDASGEVIGVNFSGSNPAAGISGLGFAIPAEIVEDVVPELVAHGAVLRATVGVSISMQQSKSDQGIRDVIRVTKVREGSPLQVGDIVTRVNGSEIRRRYDMMRLLNRSVIDTELEFEVVRGDSVHFIMVPAAARIIT